MRNRASGVMNLAAAAVVATLVLGGASTARASLGQLTLSTNYAYGTPVNNLNGFTGQPDTGYFQIQNTGPSVFTGTVSAVAIYNAGGGDWGSGPYAITLNPGDVVSLAVGFESSNVGGFNGVNGDGTSVGAILNVAGLLGSCQIDVSYNDSQFHSGVFRTNPYGVTLDNYVIQGGDPYGRDTGDDFETTQAPGVIVVNCDAVATPEPSTFAIAGLSAVVALGYLRTRRHAA